MSDLETGNKSGVDSSKKEIKKPGIDGLQDGADRDAQLAEKALDNMMANAEGLEAEADKLKDPEAPERDISPENSDQPLGQPLDMDGILQDALGGDRQFAELSQLLGNADSDPMLLGGSKLNEAAVAVDQMRMALEMYAQGAIEKAQILFNKGRPRFADALERTLTESAAKEMERGLSPQAAFAEVSKGFLQDSARLELGKVAA